MILFIIIILLLATLAIFLLERTFGLGIGDFIDDYFPVSREFLTAEWILGTIMVLLVSIVIGILLLLIFDYSKLPNFVLLAISILTTTPFVLVAIRSFILRHESHGQFWLENWSLFFIVGATIALGSFWITLYYAYKVFFEVRPS